MFAATRLGNFVTRRWRLSTGHVSAEARAALHPALLRSCLSCQDHVSRRMFGVLGDVAKIDFPKHWPDLFSSYLCPAIESASSREGDLFRSLMALHFVLKSIEGAQNPGSKLARKAAVPGAIHVIGMLWTAQARALSAELERLAKAREGEAAMVDLGRDRVVASLTPLLSLMRLFRMSSKCLYRLIRQADPSVILPPPEGGPMWPLMERVFRACMAIHRTLWYEGATEDAASCSPLTNPGAGNPWALLENLCHQTSRLLRTAPETHTVHAGVIVGPLLRSACELVAVESGIDPVTGLGLPPPSGAWAEGSPLPTWSVRGRPILSRVMWEYGSLIELVLSAPVFNPPPPSTASEGPSISGLFGAAPAEGTALAGAFSEPSAPDKSADVAQAALMGGPVVKWLLSEDRPLRLTYLCIHRLMTLPPDVLLDMASDPSSAAVQESLAESSSSRRLGMDLIGALLNRGQSVTFQVCKTVVSAIQEWEACLLPHSSRPLDITLRSLEASYAAAVLSAWTLNWPSVANGGAKLLEIAPWFEASLVPLLLSGSDTLPPPLEARLASVPSAESASARAAWPVLHRRVFMLIQAFSSELGLPQLASALECCSRALEAHNAGVVMAAASTAITISSQESITPEVVGAALPTMVTRAFTAMAREPCPEARTQVLDCLKSLTEAADHDSVRMCASSMLSPLPHLWAACSPSVRAGVIALLQSVVVRVPQGAAVLAPALSPVIASSIDIGADTSETIPCALELAQQLIEAVPDPTPPTLLDIAPLLPPLVTSDPSLGRQVSLLLRSMVLRGGEGFLSRWGVEVAVTLRGVVVDSPREGVEAAVSAADVVMSVFREPGVSVCAPVVEGAIEVVFTGAIASADSKRSEEASVALSSPVKAMSDAAPMSGEDRNTAAIRVACLTLLARAAVMNPPEVVRAAQVVLSKHVGGAAAVTSDAIASVCCRLVDAWIHRADEVSASSALRRKLWAMAISVGLAHLLPPAMALEHQRFEGALHAVAGTIVSVGYEHLQSARQVPRVASNDDEDDVFHDDDDEDAASMSPRPPSDSSHPSISDGGDDSGDVDAPVAMSGRSKLSVVLAARAGPPNSSMSSPLAVVEREVFSRDSVVQCDLAGFVRERLGVLSSNAGDSAVAAAVVRVSPSTIAIIMARERT
jgi:hypothetical protein